MRIKLLKNFERNGRTKVVARPGRTPVPFEAGNIVTTSDLTGQKWIKEGIGEEVKEAASATAVPPLKTTTAAAVVPNAPAPKGKK